VVTNAAGDPFEALGDPNRRDILRLLSEGDKAVSQIAAALPISRPAVSRHLRLLKEAGLVAEEARGTSRIYHLREEGLLDRSLIYATDINEVVLQRAKAGIFPLERMQEYTDNYIRAGGERSFSEYYVARYDGARFARELADGVVFAQHNLVSDAAFNEFHVITCRNVLIYFAQPLQARVHRLFYDSLATFGVLALGQKETIRFSPHEREFEELDADERLFKRVR